MTNMIEIIAQFLTATTTNDIRRILEEHPELLSAKVDSILNTLSENAPNAKNIALIQNRRGLLELCRKVGIPQAFENISDSYRRESRDNLKILLLQEINNLSIPQEIPRKIVLLQRLLSLTWFQSEPELWATLHMELGDSLFLNHQGNRSENLEKAIEHYNQALKVRTREFFPVEWAATLNNLAIVYGNRIQGDTAENIEKSLEYANQALKVHTREFFPVSWAATQNLLALAYLSRIKGDRAENIEKAIEYCSQALRVRTEKAFPVDWAAAQGTLGDAYWRRVLGDRAENIEKAIEYYNQTLKVYTYQDFQVAWAESQNNLANAYIDRIEGDKAENIEMAIEHFNQALRVRIEKDFPMDWATTQHNLASAYCDRIIGDKAENVERSIEYYNQSLKVRTQKDFPVNWAATQYNLAIAYKNRIRGDRAENLKKAIDFCCNGLQIYKLGFMPDNFRRISSFLGKLYIETGQWQNAVNIYMESIKAGDLLYRSGLSLESKNVEVKENVKIHQNVALAACRMGLASEGLLLLEGGKTRSLREALRLKIKQPESAPKDEWIEYEQVAEKYRTSIKISDVKEDYAQREKMIQKVLDELDAAIKVVQRYDPEFLKELDPASISQIPDSETALLIFCITDQGSIGFIVNELKGIQSLDIPSFSTKDLDHLLFKFDEKTYINGKAYIKEGWIGNYLSFLKISSAYLQAYNAYINENNNASGSERQFFEASKHHEDAFKIWQNTINETLSSIGTKLVGPILEKLPSKIKRLIIIPSGGLFLLPLHAVPLPNGQPLCQHYTVSYAPSIELLKEMQYKARKMEGKEFYAVINPEGDLVFSICEGKAISRLFQSPQVNVGESGTRATVLEGMLGRAYLHFSCHGSYNWNDPSQSGLHLFGGRTLSLADLESDTVDISSARLVTLSACETGITDIIKSSADEFVGLPAGFMLAGVPCVVSSLWSVPDISTAILMERFYSNRIKRDMDIPLALQDAQLWVRDLTSDQVATYVEKCYHSGKWEGKSKDFIEQYRERYHKMAEEYPEEKPFQHPYYWAAFTVNGV